MDQGTCVLPLSLSLSLFLPHVSLSPSLFLILFISLSLPHLSNSLTIPVPACHCRYLERLQQEDWDKLVKKREAQRALKEEVDKCNAVSTSL